MFEELNHALLLIFATCWIYPFLFYVKWAVDASFRWLQCEKFTCLYLCQGVTDYFIFIWLLQKLFSGVFFEVKKYVLVFRSFRKKLVFLGISLHYKRSSVLCIQGYALVFSLLIHWVKRTSFFVGKQDKLCLFSSVQT